MRAGLAGRRPAPVYDDTPGNPTEEAVEQALALYRADGCDGMVAMGGGSPMDLAKAVAVLGRIPGRWRATPPSLGGAPKITAAMAPLIAIPTTAGTGSEVGARRGDHLQRRPQAGAAIPHLIPKRAVCDPELTLGLPPC